MDKNSIGLIDDFCVYFLIERQHFPIKITKMFKESENELIGHFSSIHLSNESHKIVQLARDKRNISKESMLEFFKNYDSQFVLMVNIIEMVHFRKLIGWYFMLYSKECQFDISTTAKYVPKTRECCVVSRMEIPARTKILGLCGLFCPVSDDFVECLTAQNRDFSVMYSQTRQSEGIFVGPARFVNHDCNPNCEVIKVLLICLASSTRKE